MTLHWITNKDGLRVKLEVSRCPACPKAKTESAFWYELKRELKNQFGFKSIKKCPAKDGHLTSAPYYLRTHKGEVAIFDGLFMIRSLRDEYNLGEVVTLDVHHA